MIAFPFNAYLLATISAGLITWTSLPLWSRLCRRLGLVDDPGHRKIHDKVMPLAGGLALISGLVIPLMVGGLGLSLGGFLASSPLGSTATSLFSYGFSRRSLQLTVLVAGAIGMLVLGLLDDRHELGPLPKFAGQFLIAGVVASSGIRITLFVHNELFSLAVTILWILAVTNAFNFMDNMNGLCAGLGLMAAWSFAWTAAINGQFLVASICFLVSGALLGFLPHNFPRADSFLGDAGSHLVGYLCAVLAILPSFYTGANQEGLAVLKPVLILGVVLGDMAWVVILRWRLGRPIYIGDTNHLSHRLVRRGFSKTRAVLLIWLVGSVFAFLAFL